MSSPGLVKKLAIIGSTRGRAVKTASYTITRGDDKKVIVAGAADLTFTLPTGNVPAGFEVTCYTGIASVATGLTIDAPTGQTIKIGSKGSGDNLVNTQATEAVGDSVTLRYGGANTWYVMAMKGTWA